jgi:enoyl-CoA hydratase/carnithine racemase
VNNYQDILYAIEGHIAVITLNRPERLNAWTADMNSSVRRAICAAAVDAAVRVIVVTGAGRGFCAGADMDNLQRVRSGQSQGRATAPAPAGEQAEPLPSSDLGPDVSAHYGGQFGYLMSIRKPIIAAINGACAGIGLVFAMYCDLRFAAADAKFTTAFAQRGLVAEHGISWLLPRIAGVAQALDILLSARKFTGEEAVRLNLVNRAFPQQQFLSSVMEYARHLAETVSPRSMAVIKAQVWKSQYQDLNQDIDVGNAEMQKSFASDDFKEGVAHFVERRAARFTGR